MHVNPNIPPRFATSSGRACLVNVTDGEHESPVCVCYGSEETDGDAAMAKRIAALLNFAEGVPTEELRGSVHLTYTIPARAGCDPVFDGGKHYLPDVRSDAPRPVCHCSDELDRTPCPVHGKG